MIHVVYGQQLDIRLSLRENKISSLPQSKIEYLFKFTNDLTKSVKYAYGDYVATDATTNDRYVHTVIHHTTTDSLFGSGLNFKPYGYWTYEVYEVAWIGTVALNDTNAPNSETEILTVNDNNGVVQGKVHEGKLYVSETVGQEQIKYTTHTESSGTNYLYTD